MQCINIEIYKHFLAIVHFSFYAYKCINLRFYIHTFRDKCFRIKIMKEIKLNIPIFGKYLDSNIFIIDITNNKQIKTINRTHDKLTICFIRKHERFYRRISHITIIRIEYYIKSYVCIIRFTIIYMAIKHLYVIQVIIFNYLIIDCRSIPSDVTELVRKSRTTESHSRNI